MAKVTITGKDENGIFTTEVKSTAVMITELIESLDGKCEADIRHSLEEIRKSAEQDTRIRRIYRNQIKMLKALEPLEELKENDDGHEPSRF